MTCRRCGLPEELHHGEDHAYTPWSRLDPNWQTKESMKDLKRLSRKRKKKA